MGEMVAMADQGTVPLAAQQGDGVGVGVVAEPVAGKADPAAAAGHQMLGPEIGQGGECRSGGEGEDHDREEGVHLY